MSARPNALEDPGGFFKTFAGDMRPDDPALVSNPLWGYLEAGSAGFHPERILGGLGRPWYFESPGLSIKPFPSVVLSHPSMLALQDLMRSHALRPQDIARIVVRAGTSVRHIMYRMPESGTQGKFSLVYCLALMALGRDAALDDFSDEAVRSPEARAMMQRIDLLPADGLSADPLFSRIELVLQDGRSLVRDAGAYKGGPDHPLSDAELEAKFMQCAERGVGAGAGGFGARHLACADRPRIGRRADHDHAHVRATRLPRRRSSPEARASQQEFAKGKSSCHEG